MSTTELKRRLKAARKIWERDCRNPDIHGLPGFMPGVLRGYEETLRIVQECQREAVEKKFIERRGLSRWSATGLYRICLRAYGRLCQSDRAGAMRALKRALDLTDNH